MNRDFVKEYQHFHSWFSFSSLSETESFQDLSWKLSVKMDSNFYTSLLSGVWCRKCTAHPLKLNYLWDAKIAEICYAYFQGFPPIYLNLIFSIDNIGFDKLGKSRIQNQLNIFSILNMISFKFLGKSKIFRWSFLNR